MLVRRRRIKQEWRVSGESVGGKEAQEKKLVEKKEQVGAEGLLCR